MWFFPRIRRHRRDATHATTIARNTLGPRGEKAARRFLKRQGLKILAKNYRCPSGEVDLIAMDKSTRSRESTETIVFVEVKTRASDYHTDPSSAVDTAKRDRLRSIAEYYLASHNAEDYLIRFDIMSIVLPMDARPRIQHIPDAF